MDAVDWLLTPAYLLFFYLIGVNFVNRSGNNPLHRTYFLKGLTYKFIGVLFFDIIYLYYYGGGDSINFYYAMSTLFDLLINYPDSFFEFVFSNSPVFPVECIPDAKQYGIIYLLRGSASLTTIKIGGVLNLFALNKFIPLSIVFAYLSYTFQWKVFQLICSIYPSLHKQFSYAFLLLPSVVFWGSGVGKDSIMISCVFQAFYSFYHAVILRKSVVANVVYFLVACYFMSAIRGFILYATVPCMILMAVVYYRAAIQSSVIRIFIGPVFLVGGMAASVFFVQSLGQTVESYSMESLEQKAEGFRSWHTSQGGATYSLGEDMDFTPAGILSQAPMSLTITLFGPFVWQIRNPVMLMSGIESLIFLYLFVIKVFFHRRAYKMVSVVWKDHIVVFCVLFIVILGVAIGLTSFNFGALVRYRIPILPFMVSLFVILNYHFNTSAVPSQK